MTNNIGEENLFEDISSSTEKTIIDKYTNKAISNIDKVIKFFAFVVAIGIFLVFAAVAIILVLLDSLFTIVAVGVLILGIVIAIIALFLIYGMGQIMTQNNEILRRLQ
ncbi:MAG: hypothetical protein IKY45_02135 [Clostridia bacterium]|nr:hypothetical protein [Clostridia bacterium]